MAGFSAGGIITNTVAYRNANDPAYSIRAAVGYYGSDLKELMRFHSLRAAHDGSLSSDLFFSSEKLWSDTCTKSTGVQLLCGDFSSQIYNTISSNMGGVTDTKLSFFSPLAASVSGIAAAPILFAGGTLDDNVISTGSSNVLSQAGVNANQTVELTYADARHGAPWTKWPASLSWLLDRL